MSKSGVNWMMDWGKAWGLAPENWSPYVGCTPCSPGCENCWAERLEDTRLRHLNRCNGGPFNAGLVWQGPYAEESPRLWRKPRLVWCCPSSDPFHPDIADPSGSTAGPRMVDNLFGVVDLSPAHHFLMLTKRAERMAEYVSCLEERGLFIPHNLSLGITVCNQAEWDTKVPMLQQTPAAMRFISVEPMLERIRVRPQQLDCVDWVILGCESGDGRRPCEIIWMLPIIEQCKYAGTPVYVKQVDLGGRVSHDPSEWPLGFCVRKIPERR